MQLALRVVVGLIAVLIGGALGLRWMFTPEAIGGELGVSLASDLARNTMRGSIGGSYVATGVLCLLGLRAGAGAWLRAAAVIVAGIAVGRCVGLAMDGFQPQIAVLVAVEIVIIAVLLLASRPQQRAH